MSIVTRLAYLLALSGMLMACDSASGEASPSSSPRSAELSNEQVDTFDPQDQLDQALLAAYKPLGVEPGKGWDPSTVANIDGARFRAAAAKIQKEKLMILSDPDQAARIVPFVFQPKGKMQLDMLVAQSVISSIGLPAAEAMYPPVGAADDLIIELDVTNFDLSAFTRANELAAIGLETTEASIERIRTSLASLDKELFSTALSKAQTSHKGD